MTETMKASMKEICDELRQEIRQATGQRQRRDHEGRRHQRDEIAGLKLKIPPFHGKADPDAYLEWEKKIERVFNSQQYSQAQKIQIASTEFYDYALS
ncbi:hypothetical protein N665_0195s0011 [Sinapis alba]|nr:hypothetical protein N665_0195s0011 [Sinapis alba]